MGGMVLETNMNEIVAQVEVQNRMEKSEVGQIFPGAPPDPLLDPVPFDPDLVLF